MPLQSRSCEKTYSPKLSELTPDQANLLLIGHATCGHPVGKGLLDVLYPPSEPREIYNLHANFEDEESVQIKPGTSRLIHRALAAFQSSREDFRRFIRG
jgi:hypothetical protein